MKISTLDELFLAASQAITVETMGYYSGNPEDVNKHDSPATSMVYWVLPHSWDRLFDKPTEPYQVNVYIMFLKLSKLEYRQADRTPIQDAMIQAEEEFWNYIRSKGVRVRKSNYHGELLYNVTDAVMDGCGDTAILEIIAPC